MLHQEFKIDGFGMVIIQHFPFLQRKMLIVMIIIVLRKHIDAFRIQLLKYFIYYRSFSASGATCNTYYEHEIILYKYSTFEIGKRNQLSKVLIKTILTLSLSPDLHSGFYIPILS